MNNLRVFKTTEHSQDRLQRHQEQCPPTGRRTQGYLFCGNHDAAEDAAVIYTFLGCCKLANVNVRKWLSYFLNHIHDYDTDYSRDLSELFPHNLKKARIL